MKNMFHFFCSFVSPNKTMVKFYTMVRKNDWDIESQPFLPNKTQDRIYPW
jgi:hypothetical protein